MCRVMLKCTEKDEVDRGLLGHYNVMEQWFSYVVPMPVAMRVTWELVKMCKSWSHTPGLLNQKFWLCVLTKPPHNSNAS